MNIKIIRACYLSILVWITVSGHYYMNLYAAITWLFVEWMYKNRETNNVQLKNLSIFSIGYLLLIGIDRIAKFPFPKNIYPTVNIFEHLLFAAIVMMMILMILNIYLFPFRILYKIILAIVVFNCIGFINEIYQNYIGPGSIYLFSFESKKDMIVNFVGSLITGIYFMCAEKKK